MKVAQQVEELKLDLDKTENVIWEKFDEVWRICIDLYEKNKILSGRITSTHNYAQQVEKELCDLREVVEQLTQQKERFQHNLMYLEVVEDIITCTETEWDNKTFNNMLVKLVGKDEVYKVFVSTTNAPVIGSKVHFTFNADENKLSKLKIVE